MKDELGISVGIRVTRTTVKWFRAHSMMRRNDGSMCVFALDDQRTPVIIKAKDFAGVAPGIRASFSGEINPDIQEILKKSSA